MWGHDLFNQQNNNVAHNRLINFLLALKWVLIETLMMVQLLPPPPLLLLLLLLLSPYQEESRGPSHERQFNYMYIKRALFPNKSQISISCLCTTLCCASDQIT